MSVHEQNWIKQATNVKPLFYHRYVHDIFAVFEFESDADEFYNYFNIRHESIKFNFEKGKYNKFLFLDILINNKDSNLQTLVFHKKTYWVTVELFQFCITNCYKLGLIKTLVDRMYRINNSWKDFDKDLKGLENVLQKNQYLLKTIHHDVKSYLNGKINCRNEQNFSKHRIRN